MLIGSENTCICVLVILYEVLIRGNHAGGGKVLLKKSCHEITPPAAKAHKGPQTSLHKCVSDKNQHRERQKQPGGLSSPVI